MFNIQERLTAFANLGAGWVMWLLIFLSIVVLAIVLERLYYLLSARDDVPAMRQDVRKHLDAGDLDAARKRLASSKSFEAQVIFSAMEVLDQGPQTVEERINAESTLLRQRMERNLAFIGTVGNNAPFVGLLGTVIGIIRAFREMKMSGGRVSEALMSEIGEALVATAIGLLVALPAVAFFNYFNRHIRARLQLTSAMANDLLGYAKKER
jgi:biopolymer transport protein ExbB